MGTSNTRWFVTLVSLVLAVPISAQERTGEAPVLQGPYLGQKPPGITPEIFAPGIVSSPDARELGGGTFSPDGREYYFTRAHDGRWRIMVSRLESGGWSIPEVLSLCDGRTALEPHITFDNQRMFWASWGWRETGTYVAERTLDGWSVNEYAGPGMMVSSTRDGRMFVTDLRQDTNQIVEVRFEKGRLGNFERLRGGIEQFQNQNRSAHPAVAPDGSFLIFDENGSHLYVSFRGSDDEWGSPIDLADFGFDPQAGVASISPDGEYLFFGQADDVYWVSTRVIEALRPRRHE